MRIAIDARECLDPWTGMGRYGLAVITELAARGRHEYVIVVPADRDLPAELTTLEVEIVRSRAPAYSAREHWHLPRELSGARVDLYHALTYTRPLFCPIASSLMLFDVVPLLFPRQYRLRALCYWRTLLRFNLHRARRIGTLSRTSRAAILAHFRVAPEKIVVLPAGVTAAAVTESSPPLAGKPYVLVHGNQRPHKNLAVLAPMMARLRVDHPDLQLMISGGERKDSVGFTHWPGRVDDLDLSRLYAHASVYLLPSLYEGAGLTPLEAMARGTPVVVSDRGALPELYEAAATIAAPDPESLANAVTALLRYPITARKQGDRGRLLAASRTWDHAAAALEAMLEAAASA